MSSAYGTQPGPLTASSLRQVVAVLAITQITSWGVLYYAFAALSSSIAAETGWSTVAVTGAFSTSQLVSAGAGVWVGRHIDTFGPRHVMTAGSLLSVPGVLLVATAPHLAAFYVGWVVVGLAMAGVLYPPAFVALTHWGGQERVRALTTLTLVAGLASTVFAPLAAWLDDWQGWRWTYVILLVLQVVVTVPLHWWGLRHPWSHAPPSPSTTRAPEPDPAPTASVARSRPFILLTVAMAMASLAVFAVVINLVPMLVEQGLSRNLAAVALGLGGVGQVAGRLGFARLARHTTATTRTVLVVLGIGVATAALALAPGGAITLVSLSMLVGLTRGLYTLIQATAVTDRWGPAGYGTLNGVLTAPSLLAAASAPFVGAALAEGLGSFSAAFLVMAGVAAAAAMLAALAAPRTGVSGTQPAR